MSPLNTFRTFYDIFREISTFVHSSTSVDEVLELVAWKVSESLNAKGAIIRVLNTETQELELFSAYGMGERYLSKNPVSNHVTIKDICRLNKPIIIQDISKDPRIQYTREVLEEGIKTILDLPLIVRTHMLGVIRIFFAQKREFSAEEMNFVFAVVEQCGCALDKALTFEEQQLQYDHLALQTEKLSALGRMAAGIAHEINNPLAGILLFSTNLRKKVPEEGNLREGLDVIIRETQRCKGIIQGLLEFSRDKEPKKVLANMNDIIEKVLSILGNEFRLHHITVEKNLSSKMPESMLDVNQMQQVFTNLLINAIEAIQEDGVIKIKSYMTPDKKAERIEIEDSGCGIPPDQIEKIFEPFFSTKKDGTGLGLAVSYGIIQKHQGSIRVSSEPNQGTRFTIEIPHIQ